MRNPTLAQRATTNSLVSTIPMTFRGSIRPEESRVGVEIGPQSPSLIVYVAILVVWITALYFAAAASASRCSKPETIEGPGSLRPGGGRPRPNLFSTARSYGRKGQPWHVHCKAARCQRKETYG